MTTQPPKGARLPVLVLGAGAIGRMHIERIVQHPDVCLAGIADPSSAAKDLAYTLAVPWAAEPAELLDKVRAGAAIVATPNHTHADLGIACLEKGLVTLVEKPIADTLEQAERLMKASAQYNIPVLVGHHRRHNPITRTAKKIIEEGLLGRPVSATVMSTWYKPDSYFKPAWRRAPGAGPVLINMIHDIDLLRFLFGEIRSVSALTSQGIRQFDVEDTAGALLQFENGAIASIVVSDTSTSPWNWDLAAGEADHYPQQPVDTIFLTGTEGGLSLPRLHLSRYLDERSWHAPLTTTVLPVYRRDPYIEQLSHLRALADGSADTPLCSAKDGWKTLQATLAVHASAKTQRPEIL